MSLSHNGCRRGGVKLTLVLGLLLCLGITCITCQLTFTGHDSTFHGMLCSPLSHDFGEVRTRLSCAVQCDQHVSCAGFFHSGAERRCFGVSHSLLSTQDCSSVGSNSSYRFYAKDKCSVGWRLVGGSCYFLDESVIIRASEVNFVTYCQDYVDPNSYMLHVETAEKQILVEQMLQNRTSPASSVCLGLHSAASDNNWIWSGTGAALTYSNWGLEEGADNQPFTRMDASTFVWRDTLSSECTPVCEIP